jgi:phage terminase large subunit
MEFNSTIIFEKNYDALLNSDKKFIVNQGGSRSSKTWSLCQLVIVWAISNPNKTISIVRKTLSTLKSTAMKDFFAIMKEQDIYDVKKHNKTENIYKFDNGTIVEFFSTDDEQKLRGRKRDLCWANEANELYYDDYFQLNLRTSFKFILDYNPSESDSWIYELPDDNKIIIKSTYRDNPFLERTIIEGIESLKYTDESLYQIYALGEKAMSRKNVYNNWTFLQQRPEKFTEFVYGLDFGYNHPCALVRVYYYDDEIWIETVIYESGLNNSELGNKMKQLQIDEFTDIMCDYARPEAIAELRDMGFNVHNGDKAVKAGINNVKTFKVFASEYDKELKKEYSNYMWKVNGDRISDEPTKNWDDAMDAIRYAVMQIKKTSGESPLWSF